MQPSSSASGNGAPSMSTTVSGVQHRSLPRGAPITDDLADRVKHIETVRQGLDSTVGDTVLLRGQDREP